MVQAVDVVYMLLRKRIIKRFVLFLKHVLLLLMWPISRFDMFLQFLQILVMRHHYLIISVNKTIGYEILVSIMVYHFFRWNWFVCFRQSGKIVLLKFLNACFNVLWFYQVWSFGALLCIYVSRSQLINSVPQV